MSSRTPASLLERLRGAPDAEHWSRFVDLYSPLLFAWCHRLGLREPETADLVQDVFLILVEQLPRFQYDPRRSFRAWLKTVLLNVWRKQQSRRQAVPAGAAPLSDVPDTDPRLELEEAEYRRQLVGRALALMQAEFEPSTWQACWDVLVHDQPAAAVAARLGVTVNAVYLAKSRVLRRLRAELNGLLD